MRHRVKDVIEFLQDDDRLRSERKQAKTSKEKYQGFSGNEFGRHGGFSELIKKIFLHTYFALSR